MKMVDKLMLLIVVASSIMAANAMYTPYVSHYPNNGYNPYASVPHHQQPHHNPNAYGNYRYAQNGYPSHQTQNSGPYFYNGYQYAVQHRPVQHYSYQNAYNPNSAGSPVPNQYQNGVSYYNQNQQPQYQSQQATPNAYLQQGSTYTQNPISQSGAPPVVISAGNTYVEPSPKTPTTECVMADQYKELCVNYGITEEQCILENCCWDSTSASSPWCYKPITTQNNDRQTASISAAAPAPLYQQTTQERRVCLRSSYRLRESCTELGCCYDTTDSMCYYKQENTDTCPEVNVEKAKKECRLPQGPVKVCGYQISSSDCVDMGCCYGMIDSEPVCYENEERNENQQDLIQPLTGVSLPGAQGNFAPTAPAKVNLLDMLKEMEKNIKPTEKINLLNLLKSIETGKEIVPKTAKQEVDTGPKLRPKAIPPPTLPPPRTQYQCDPRGRGCRIITLPQRMCFPQKCGSPAFTPAKIPNKFDPKKIVGGTRAFPFSHPWTVMIQKTEGNKTFICGATLICNQWLITAAHCLDQQTGFKNTPDLNPDMYKIFLGRYQGWKRKPGLQVQVFKGRKDIAIMYQHEKFQPGKHRGVITHDIALIKLRKRVIIDDYVQPACMPEEPPKPGEVMFATGWGVTRNKGPSASTLKQVGVEIREQRACKDRVPGFGNPQGVICAGGEKWHDTCTGDSGGPLVGSKTPPKQRNRGGGLSSLFGGGSQQKPQEARWIVYGLTSIGSPSCNTLTFDRQPAIYTDVFYYRNWIKKYTQNCCG